MADPKQQKIQSELHVQATNLDSKKKAQKDPHEELTRASPVSNPASAAAPGRKPLFRA